MTKLYAQEFDIEDTGGITFRDDKEVMLCSIAISLKRMADTMTAKLVELPTQHGTAFVRASQVANISVNGRDKTIAFVQMIGDHEETGFQVNLSVEETVKKLQS